MVGMELTPPQGVVGARADARVHRRGRAPEAASRHVRAPSSRPRLEGGDRSGDGKAARGPVGPSRSLGLRRACALLGDEAAAARAVTQAMLDLALLPWRVAEDARRSWCVAYWRSQEVQVQSSGAPHLPPVMVWLGQLVQLQRACWRCASSAGRPTEKPGPARRAARHGRRAASGRIAGAGPGCRQHRHPA